MTEIKKTETKLLHIVVYNPTMTQHWFADMANTLYAMLQSRFPHVTLLHTMTKDYYENETQSKQVWILFGAHLEDYP